jgi:hypothetical protein
MTKWHKVYETGSPIRAEIIKGVLTERGIVAVILNKRESVYHIHGNFEIMTSTEDVVQAINIIDNEITF